MDAPGILRALRDSWRLLLVGALLGGALAEVLVLVAAPVYTTETRFFISMSAADSTNAAYEGNLFSQQRVTSYAELVTDQRVTAAVINQLGLDVTPAELADQMEATVVPNTVILAVAVSDPSPTRAVEIAQATSQSFADVVTVLETPQGSRASTVDVHVIAAPLLPQVPTSPRPLRDVATGLVVGFAVAAAVALLRRRLSTRIRTGDQAAEHVGAPVVGMTLVDEDLAAGKVLSTTSSSETLEAIRRIRTNLDFIKAGDPPKVLVVTSAMPGEGKTALAVNLAVQFAAEGRSVTLVDADLRQPGVTRWLDLPGEVGLADVVDGSAELEEAVQSLDSHDRLEVLAAGAAPPDPAGLLTSSPMQQLLETLRKRSDIVILDASSLLPVADTSGLAGLADGVLMCVRWGSTKQGQLRQSRLALERVNARVLGVVLTSVDRSAAAADGYAEAKSSSVRGPFGRRAPAESKTVPLTSGRRQLNDAAG